MENKDNTDWFVRFFEWLNPTAYKILAAILPYITPLPVAALTAQSATDFLGFKGAIPFIFVFALEGLGLWFTGLLVDSFVEWVRSRNVKSFFPVLLFGVVVAIYIKILVTLNVTLEAAAGKNDPALATVITLLCYLPLISGVGNGWYKLRLEDKQKREKDTRHAETREDIQKQQDREHEKEILRIKEEQKTERTKAKAQAVTPVQMLPQQMYQQTTAQAQETASKYLLEIFELLSDAYKATGKVLRVKEIADHFHLDYERNKGYISTKRKEWAVKNNVELPKKRTV